MPKLSAEQISAMVNTGALNREIEAALGRRMNAGERTIVDRARVIWRLKRAQRSPGDSKSKAALMRANRKRENVIRDENPEDFKRRKRLEKDPAKWLQWYIPEKYSAPFCDTHKEMIDAGVRAMRDGTSMTVAAPRGFGKTAVLWGIPLFGVLTGTTRFPVVIGWKVTAGDELLDQWLNELSTNQRLLADYPSACRPFHESTASKRLQGLLRSLEPEIRAGCDVRKRRGMVILPTINEPDGRTLLQAALAGASINGSIKGLNIGLVTGEALRPDCILLDDPQDTETGMSDPLTDKVIRKIDYDLRSLSGPMRRLAVMAAVTVVRDGDVATKLLERPGTQGIRLGQINHWPEDWNKKDSKSKQAWDEWRDEQLEGLADKDGGERARVYYRKHKRKLSAGFQVSWKHRYHHGDENRPSDPDALFSAMWDYYDLGEDAFMAERQNTPIKHGVSLYTLNADVIKSRQDKDRQPFVIPDWSKLVVTATDINPSYGLSSVTLSFGSDQTAAVLWYGIYEDAPLPVTAEMTEAQTAQIIYEALVLHGKQLAASACVPETWVIDAGGSAFDVVIRFCKNSKKTCGLEAIPATGRASRKYRPFGRNVLGKPREQCHQRCDPNRRKWVVWNADYWRELAQKGWTGSIGAPGSCTLFAGHHQDFPEQICREQLQGKAEVGGQMIWVWNTQPGKHDYGDCMAMAYMGAAWNGIGTGGREDKPKKVARVIINRPSRRTK